MRTALEEAFGLAEITPIADAADPVPFTTRRRMAQLALARLEEQIEYLTEWRDRLNSNHLSISLARGKDRKEVRTYTPLAASNY